MARWIGGSLAAGIAVFACTVVAWGGVFPEPGARAFCDSNLGDGPPTFWGAGEVQGDRNDVVGSFRESSNGVAVRHAYAPAVGDASVDLTVCQSKEADWNRFVADLGTRADSVRFGPVPEAGKGFASPPRRVVAKIDLGPGRDVASGHAGPDKVKGGPGRDEINTGAGRDKVRVAGGGKDEVDCGAGKNDRAVVDERDAISACEHLRVKE